MRKKKFEDIEKNLLTHFRKLLISAISMSHIKKKFWQNMTSRWLKKNELSREISGNYVIMAFKWRRISKFLQPIERGDQYDSFDMPINSMTISNGAKLNICSFFYMLVIKRRRSTLVNLWHHFWSKMKKNRDPKDYI